MERNVVTLTLTRSLRLIRTEAIITAATIAMPIMNSFFAGIGLSQGQLGLSQALFTLALFMLNVPSGWLADRFSRKLCNALGDVVAACGFLYYAFAHSFFDVVVAEIILGTGLAFTQGADVGLLRAYCQELKRDYKKESALIATLRPLTEGACMILGGIIGAYEPRLALALSAVPLLAGCVLSLFAHEVGTHREEYEKGRSLRQQIRGAVTDMKNIVIYALHGHKDLAWSIAAASIGREITHALVWILTPLLLLAGIPSAVIGIAWALQLGAVSVGAWISRWFMNRWSEVMLFTIPAITCLSVMFMLSYSISGWTVGLYALLGLSRGWYSAILPPLVQHHTPDSMQSTVFSINTSLSQLLYIAVVTVVSMAGNISVGTAMMVNAIIFFPFVAVVALKLKKRR
jgi:MFS family permease